VGLGIPLVLVSILCLWMVKTGMGSSKRTNIEPEPEPEPKHGGDDADQRRHYLRPLRELPTPGDQTEMDALSPTVRELE
jgi:hypothetical protein